jgi:hypothetical protein
VAAAESMLVSLTIPTLTGAVAFSLLALVDGTTGVPAAGAFWVAIAWVVLLSTSAATNPCCT